MVCAHTVCAVHKRPDQGISGREALVKRQPQPLEHEDVPMATDVPKVRTQGQMLKELGEREEGCNSKHSPGHNPGALDLEGPGESRQEIEADSRDRCSVLFSFITSVGSKEWSWISSENVQRWHGAHQLVPVDQMLKLT